MPNKVKFSSVHCKSYWKKHQTTTWDKFSQNFQGRKIKTRQKTKKKQDPKIKFSGGNCKLYQTKNKTKELILKDHKKQKQKQKQKHNLPKNIKKCTQCNTHIQKIGEKCEHCYSQPRTEEVFRFCTQSQLPFKILKKVKMTFN